VVSVFRGEKRFYGVVFPRCCGVKVKGDRRLTTEHTEYTEENLLGLRGLVSLYDALYCDK